MIIVAIKDHKMQKRLEKIAVNQKNILARPTIYDRACLEKLSKASPGNPVGNTPPSSLFLFAKQSKNIFGRVDISYGNLFLTYF